MIASNLTGKKFNRLTGIERIPSTRQGVARWLCQCDCGNQYEANAIDIKCGKVKSCGCSRKRDLTGKRFGRLVALRPASPIGNCSRWLCQCNCGKEAIVRITCLSNGHTKSCGCLHLETVRKNSLKHGHAKAGEKSRTYIAWASMRNRCRSPHNQDYKYYGGRGIKVIPRWNSFELFLKDMKECPPNFTIERKNTDGHYEPKNCHWIPKSKQARNRRDTVRITLNGVSRPLAEWAELLNLKAITIHMRLRRGCSPEEALTQGRKPRSM